MNKKKKMKMKQSSLEQLWCDPHEWDLTTKTTKFIQINPPENLYKKIVTYKYKCKKCFKTKEETKE